MNVNCRLGGSCESIKDSDFDQFVGETALIGESVSPKYCDCEADLYGVKCDKNLQEFQEFADCGEYGIFDKKNTVTGCSCRESIDGNATDHHGWYCEIHNR